MRKIVFFLAFFLLLKPNYVFADAKFNVNSDITYKIADNGVTTVTQNFTFTNLTTQYFPSEYVTNLPIKDVSNLRAFDKTGALQVETSLNNNIRQVKIRLGDQAVGVSSSTTWTLAYETAEIAKKSGRLWEIFVPRPATIEGESDFTIGLFIPQSFGKRVYIKPAPSIENQIWKRSDLTGAGVFAVYDPTGSPQTYQAYDFKLTYHLYNPKLYPALVEITLPPDTSRQKVFLSDLSPKPINVREDADGNWLAKYQLGPTQKEEVVAKGSLGIFLNDKFTPPPISMTSYLSVQKFWEVNDSKISEISQRFNSARDVYDFVVSNLRYIKGPTRLGAKGVLENPLKATALEFTDLFVALARSAKIPAREIEGYTNGALHTWPEYFDSANQSWIPVDPTWARITNGTDYFDILDFDHIVFAIHGQSSFSPPPAGTYNGGNQKDVEISFHQGDLDFTVQPKLGLRSDFPSPITSGFPSSARVFIENYGPTTFNGETAALTSETFTFTNPSLSTGKLLPFANTTLEFSLLPLGWSQDKNDIITLQFGQEIRQFPVASKPFYKNKFILTVSILFALGILSIFAQITRSLLISRRKRESNLRRKSEKSS